MARSELDPYGNNQTAASRVGQDQAAQSRIRAAQKNEFERNKTSQANAGANSLARASTFAAETTPRLGTLTQRQSPLPAMNPYSSPRGISNPPPMTNFRPGESGARSLADTRTIYARPAPVGHGLTGNRAIDDANQKADLAANLDWARNPTETRQPTQLDPYTSAGAQPNADALLGKDTSNAVNEPDANGNLAHSAGLASFGQNRVAMTPYGGIASRIPYAGEPAQPTVAPNAQGVQHPWNSDAAHLALAADPTMKGVFTAGTPENAAFVAHAQQFGPQSAFQNAASIVQQSRSNAQATSQQPGATPPAGPAGGVVGFQAGTAPVSKMNAYGATPPRPTGQPPTPLGGRNITASTEG